MSKNGIFTRNFWKFVVAFAVCAATAGVFQIVQNSLSDLPTETTAVSSAAYMPGTYTATADGVGKITVTATFDAEKITHIELDVSGETEAIGGKARDALVSQMLAAQGGEIDGVSGATVTADAAQTALRKCIDQAKAPQ